MRKRNHSQVDSEGVTDLCEVRHDFSLKANILYVNLIHGFKKRMI